MELNQNWTETKKECDVDEDGNLVTKKVTLEASKKRICGIDLKDFVDLLVKALGLGAILFTALNYLNTVNQQKKSEQQKIIDRQEQQLKEGRQALKEKESYIRQLQKDSVENIKYQKEQNRLDSELKLKQIDVLNAQITNDKNFKQRQAQFEKSLANSLETIFLQQKVDLDKEKTILQFKLYRSINSEIFNLLNKRLSEEDFEKTKNHLFNNLYPDLIAFEDSSVISKFKEVKHYIGYYQSLNEAYELADSIRIYSKQIFNRLDFPRNILSNYNISNEINDTVFYFNNKYNTFKKIKELRIKGDEMRALKFQGQEYKGELETKYYKLMRLIQSNIPDGYNSYNDELHLYIQVGLGNYNFKKNKENATHAKKLAIKLGSGEWEEVFDKLDQEVDLIKETADYIKEAIINMNYQMEALMIESNKLTTPK